MDFEFSTEEQAFAAEVEAFLDEHATPDVADVTRENMAQIVDTPERRGVHEEDGGARLDGHDVAQGVWGPGEARASTSTS